MLVIIIILIRKGLLYNNILTTTTMILNIYISNFDFPDIIFDTYYFKIIILPIFDILIDFSSIYIRTYSDDIQLYIFLSEYSECAHKILSLCLNRIDDWLNDITHSLLESRKPMQFVSRFLIIDHNSQIHPFCPVILNLLLTPQL